MMNYFLDEDKSDLVSRDGFPRVVRGHDEMGAAAPHVQYESNGVVTSMLATDWMTQHGALPTDPTQAQIDAAVAARAAAQAQAQADAAALRQRVMSTLQTAVGVPFDNLSTPQLKAVVEALAWKAGALNNDTTVRPPADWLR